MLPDPKPHTIWTPGSQEAALPSHFWGHEEVFKGSSEAEWGQKVEATSQSPKAHRAIILQIRKHMPRDAKSKKSLSRTSNVMSNFDLHLTGLPAALKGQHFSPPESFSPHSLV